MCGILAALLCGGSPEANRRSVLRATKLQRHRGPDASAVYQTAKGNNLFAFERLNIIDPSDSGKQPFILERPQGRLVWALNSEIYNHEAIKADQLAGVPIVKNSKSDSAIIGHMYEKMGGGPELWNALDGIFACVLLDEATGDFTVARDPMGICSLYWGRGQDSSYWFSSEMKGLQHACVSFGYFPPGKGPADCSPKFKALVRPHGKGHVFSSRTGQLERFYKPVWAEPDYHPTNALDLTAIREGFITSVVKRLMSDAPLAVLLSGGLDSSLVAAVAVRHLKEAKNTYSTNKRLHTFSIGIEGAPDLLAARSVAQHLGTHHHEFHFTVQEGLDALYDLIFHIESYEQVRAAVPMYLLARRIKALGIKVVLSGEGADEVFGGYLYFHKAPSPEEFHKETVRKTMRLHQWDVLRANKAPFAFGVESRVPFLDRAFLDTCMTVDSAEKMGFTTQISMADRPDGKHPRMEKYILRKAFDLPHDPYLPDHVLYRQKEQFSDGVGYDWVNGLKAFADKEVTAEMWESRQSRFPEHTPTNKEYYLLRSMFEEHFPSKSALDTVPKGLSIACSTPEAISWDPSWAGSHEISGRAMRNVHESAEGFAHNTARAGPPSAAAQLPSNDAVEATMMAAATAVSSAEAVLPDEASKAPAEEKVIKRTASGRRIGSGIQHWAPRMSIDINGDGDESARHSFDKDSGEEEEGKPVVETDAYSRLGTDVSHFAPRYSSDMEATAGNGSLAHLAPRLEPNAARRAAARRPAVAAASIRGSQPQVEATDRGQDGRAAAYKDPFGTDVSHWDASSRLSGDWATAQDAEGIDTSLLSAVAKLRLAPGDEADPEAPEAPFEHFSPKVSKEHPVSLSVDGSR